MLENHDVRIAVGTPIEQAHTNYAVGRAAILSNNDVCFSRKMALEALRPFQIYVHCVVFDMNFNIMAHFQLKI
jgi:hypothetical protein